MPKKTGQVSRRIVLVVIVTMLSVLFVLFTAYTKYIYAQDYNFIIEAPCDPGEMTCFVRDCDDYCPPNELEVYRAYEIPATDYNLCTDNSCTNICQNVDTMSSCVPILCNLDNGDDCTS